MLLLTYRCLQFGLLRQLNSLSYIGGEGVEGGQVVLVLPVSHTLCVLLAC